MYNVFLRVCWYFILFGALYKLKFVEKKGNFFFLLAFRWKYRALSGKFSHFSFSASFSLLFFYFLDCQTPLRMTTQGIVG